MRDLIGVLPAGESSVREKKSREVFLLCDSIFTVMTTEILIGADFVIGKLMRRNFNLNFPKNSLWC